MYDQSKLALAQCDVGRRVRASQERHGEQAVQSRNHQEPQGRQQEVRSRRVAGRVDGEPAVRRGSDLPGAVLDVLIVVGIVVIAFMVLRYMLAVDAMMASL